MGKEELLMDLQLTMQGVITQAIQQFLYYIMEMLVLEFKQKLKLMLF